MGLPAEKRFHTVEDYLRWEQSSTSRHEFHDGEILAMAGASPDHSLIAMNLGAALNRRLQGNPCHAYGSDLKVGLRGAGRFVYPDLSVVCSPREFDPRDPARQTIINPRVIVEVLSPTTEAYDRGEKFDKYCELEPLEEYILVSQGEPAIQAFYRQPDGTWLFTRFAGLKANVIVRSLGLETPLSEVYAGVELPPFKAADEFPGGSKSL